jgi:HEAT repeat protein
MVLEVISREDPKKDQLFAQLSAMRLVVPLGLGREAAPLLKKKLISDQVHRKMVRDAIEILGLIGDPGAIPDVGPFLSPLPLPGEMGGGQDLVTPCYAALALHRLGDDSGVPFLKQLLSHPAQSVQVQAALTLADMGDPSGIPVFEARLRNPAVNKTYIIRGVGELKTPEARKILERTIQFDSPELAQISAVYLAEQGDSNGNRLLQRELKETDPDRSFNAARRLVRLGDASAVPFLEEHYQDIDIERRIAAVAALASFGSSVGFKDLYEGLQEQRWGYRAASAAFLLLLT